MNQGGLEAGNFLRCAYVRAYVKCMRQLKGKGRVRALIEYWQMLEGAQITRMVHHNLRQVLQSVNAMSICASTLPRNL
jgi:hypothetical protein